MGRNVFLSDLETELSTLKMAVTKHQNSVTKATATLESAKRLLTEGTDKVETLETQISTLSDFGAIGGHIDNEGNLSIMVRLVDGKPVSYTPDGKEM